MDINAIAVATVGVLATTACGPNLEVKAAPTPVPEASLTGYHTFRLLPGAQYLGGVPVGSEHPLLANSTTERALRHDIASTLAHRGYAAADSDADLLVVYYLVMPPELDASDPELVYATREPWARGSGPGSVDLTPSEYADGAVVIEMIDARSGTLRWQGHRVADASGDERRYERTLRQTVTAMVRELPGPVTALE
jgi:hypothetical protein